MYREGQQSVVRDKWQRYKIVTFERSTIKKDNKITMLNFGKKSNPEDGRI